MKKLSRKGVFFTFIAILIMILIFAIVTTKDKFRYREKASAVASRVETMNDFISDFEKDAERELYIGGYRALLGMNSYIKLSEGYVADFDSVFAEILVNGSINGTDINIMSQGSQGADINSWLGRINEEALKLNIEVSTEIESITVVQESPWSVIVKLGMRINITDSRGLAKYDFRRTYSREFSILGFEDPLYTVGTRDKVSNLINITPDLDFVDEGDASVLTSHLLNSYYVHSAQAPSFLMRFSGNLTPSPFGIESMVNLEKIDAQNLLIEPRSVIDYIYFGNQSTVDYCDPSGTEPWFRIDSDHLLFYEADQLNMTGC